MHAAQKKLKAFVDTNGDALRWDYWRDRYDGLPLQEERAWVAQHKYNSLTSKIKEENVEGSTKADLEYLASTEYRSNFDGLFKKGKLNGEVCKLTRRAIKENDGTITESYAFVMSDGTTSGLMKSGKYGGFIDLSILNNAPKESAVLTHNHPRSTSFSADDIDLLLKVPQISTIIAAGHDGTVYKLSVGKGKRQVDRNLVSEYNILKEYYENDIHSVVSNFAKKYGWRYERIEKRSQPV